jgi:hypothetical protein
MHKSIFVCFAAAAVIAACSADAFALSDRKDYFTRPQIGGWFGIVTPLASLTKKVDSSLGGGVFVRFTFPWQYLKFGVDASYQKFKQKGDNGLQFVPIYGNLLFQLPFDFPVRFQLKGGAGLGYVYILPDKIGQWEPVFVGGFEVSFPAGRVVNIGLRIDYIYIYEGYIKSARGGGGHIINSGIQLYFNI